MRNLSTIDLFCGAGGITEGFHQAGFDCIYANDKDLDSTQTFRLNHPRTEVSTGPIEEIDPVQIASTLGVSPGEVDCLVGGPPCQGFSINAPERFLEDPRNALFRRYLDFVRVFRPKTLLFENVPGMLSLENGCIAQQIIDSIGALGYNESIKILFAAHYGVPQARWRLIILASRIGPPPLHPNPTHAATGRANFAGGRTLTFRLSGVETEELRPYISVKDAIGDLPELSSGGGTELSDYVRQPHTQYAASMRNGDSVLTHHVAPNIAPINMERLQHIKPGGSWRDLPYELLPEGMKRARRSDHTKRYGRLLPDGLSATVMTKMDPHWGPVFHYAQDRTLSVREAARLQSFPDTYTFSGSRVSQYRQIGNAVPVLMAHAIAQEIKSAIGASGEHP